jgi:cobalt-zinc-cadmium efflux system outer membrane protein
MKRSKSVPVFILFVLTFWAGRGPLWARDGAQIVPVVLEDLLEEALSVNPRVMAAENEWRAAMETIPQAKAMPDPMLSYGHFFSSIETRLGPQRNKLSLSQRLPFFGKLSLKEKIAGQQAFVLEEQFQQARLEVILQVKEAYYSLYWIDEAVAIAENEKDVLRRLAQAARKKYAAGTAAQQDALKAQLEISKLTDRLLILGQGRRSAISQLNSLLNRPSDTDMGPVRQAALPALTSDPDSLLARAQEARPELRRADRVIQKNNLHVELAKKNYWPDLNVMVDYFDIGSGSTTHPEDGRNAWMASVGINIPLWRGKLRAAEAEASIRLKASQDLRQDLHNNTSARIRELFTEVKMYEEQTQLYEYSLIPQAEQALRSAEIAYIAGQTDFLSILDGERMLIQLKTAFAKLTADRGKSLARLERVVGNEILEEGQ